MNSGFNNKKSVPQAKLKTTYLPEEHMSNAEENTELSRCGSSTDNL